MSQNELIFMKGKRKYLFCADSQGARTLFSIVSHTMEERTPFDFHTVGEEPDAFLEKWFSQQKMGTYLYVSGQVEFVQRVKKLASKAGFTEYEMQTKIVGALRKRVICSKCYVSNEVEDELHISCMNCGLELEVSTHYSRRLEGYMGYYSI